MKLIGAKKELEAFVKENKGKIDGALYKKKLCDKVLELSHKVCNEPSLAGHFARQQIRRELRLSLGE